MSTQIPELLQRLLGLPEGWLYVVLGAAAALENLIPPIPADVVILLGGFLAGHGAARVWAVFLVVWLSNVAGAMLVFAIGRRYGAGFFSGRWGRMVLQRHQLDSLDGLYRRHGFLVIFVSRFLPMFRAVVPAFAGIAGLRPALALLPIAFASGLWYGALILLGAAAGRNWQRVLEMLQRSSGWLGGIALIVLLAVARWWWVSRNAPAEP